jgi:ferredoxin
MPFSNPERPAGIILAQGKVMKTTLFYLTGTGNSLWVARTLAQALGGAEVKSIAVGKKEKAADSRGIGLVFPVHIWGVPRLVLEFVRELKALHPDYAFAIAVNAGQVANTLVQLQKVLKKNGVNLSTGFEIPMPSNYIPWGGPGPREKQDQRFASAKKRISEIAAAIKDKEELPVERGPLWQRILFSPFYKMTFSQVPKMDRKFWVDEKCNQCSICSKVCPVQNITLQDGKPVWNHRCEQCFACLQWCPQEAIQYGKKTPQYQRYHHPEVQLNDILKLRPSSP